MEIQLLGDEGMFISGIFVLRIYNLKLKFNGALFVMMIFIFILTGGSAFVR